MNKFDRLIVKLAPLLLLVALIGVPSGVWYYEKVAVMSKYPPDAKIFTLTGYGEMGLWTLDNVAGYNYWRGAGERANNIVVNKGDTVVFRLTSADVYHSFSIPDLGVHAKELIKVGGITEVVFVADEPGIYTFRCREFCGPLHPAMFGTLTVLDF